MIGFNTHVYCRDIMTDSQCALGNWRPIKRVVFSFFQHLLAFRFGKERKTRKDTHMYIYCYFFFTRKEYFEVFYVYVHLRMCVYVRMHF